MQDTRYVPAHVLKLASSHKIWLLKYLCPKVELAGSEQATYSAILGKLMQETTEPLMGAFTVIDKVISDVSKYVAVWLQYQSLWDMEQGTITAHLGEDLGKWQQLLHEIK